MAIGITCGDGFVWELVCHQRSVRLTSMINSANRCSEFLAVMLVKCALDTWDCILLTAEGDHMEWLCLLSQAFLWT